MTRPAYLDRMRLTPRGREDLGLALLAGACIALIFVVRYA